MPIGCSWSLTTSQVFAFFNRVTMPSPSLSEYCKATGGDAMVEIGMPSLVDDAADDDADDMSNFGMKPG